MLEVLYESLVMKIVRRHRKLMKNAPVGAPNLVRIRDFQVFRDFGAQGLTLGAPELFPQRVTLHETESIREIRTSSFRKNT